MDVIKMSANYKEKTLKEIMEGCPNQFDQMGEDEIRKFLHYLLTKKGNTPATVNAYNSALCFLYGETLDIVLNIKKLPRPRLYLNPF